jgi:hypothetical protein
VKLSVRVAAWLRVLPGGPVCRAPPDTHTEPAPVPL